MANAIQLESENTKIPTAVFLETTDFLTSLDPEKLSADQQTSYALLLCYYLQRKGKMAIRQAYAEVVRAGRNEADRAAAYENYKNTKRFYSLDAKRYAPS
jgi:hypothetical protein